MKNIQLLILALAKIYFLLYLLNLFDNLFLTAFMPPVDFIFYYTERKCH